VEENMMKFSKVKKVFLDPNFLYLSRRFSKDGSCLILLRLIYGLIYNALYTRFVSITAKLGIFKKIRFKGRVSVVKLCDQIKSLEIKADFFHVTFKSLPLDESKGIPDKIEIASSFITCTDNLFSLNFDDNEDMFSIHRFAWLVKSLGEGASTVKIEWIVKQIQNWCDKYQSVNDVRVFESYSISERLVSWCFIIIFIGQYIGKSSFWNKLHESIELQLFFLIKHLEYHGKFTNNHILNNARCLYICGRLFKLADVANLGKEIIFREFLEIVQDGVYQEGSSHYQMLLTKSFLELLFIAELTGDRVFEDWLRIEIQKMRCVCKKLISEYPSEEYPFFGDISPDTGPDWMLGYPFSVTGQKISPWQNLFQLVIADPEEQVILKKSNIEYVKLRSSIWEVWVNIKKTGVLCHGHNDNGQVVVFKKGVPVMVDIGRSRYSEHVESELGNQMDPQYHSIPRFEDSPVEYHKSQGTIEFMATQATIKSRTENSLIFDIVYYSGKVVTREISVDEKMGVKIIDRLSIGNEKEKFNLTWHFAASETEKTLSDDNILIKLKNCASIKISSLAVGFGVSIEDSYRSTSYGNKVPAVALNIEGELSANHPTETSIY
jgi:hypothetical protein